MSARRWVNGWFTIVLLQSLAADAQHRGDCGGQQPKGWSRVIAGPEEPGERMILEGRVLDETGSTPLAGVVVFVFHTDARGYYSPGGMDESNARLCGLVETDADGRYRFETIRPAHYATGGPPAHVHFRVWGPGLARQNDLLQFADDPMVRAEPRDFADRPTWATVRPVERRGDTLYVLKDLKISR